MAKHATLKRYDAGGYLLTLPDGSEYEADTTAEAFNFARSEGFSRVYSASKTDRFVQLTIEEK